MLKKILILTTLFLSIMYSHYAPGCDVCGCSVGGNYFDILPQFRQHFIGVRYQYQSFTSEHPPLFEGSKAVVSREYFHTAEVWGRFYPHPRVQIFAFVPFHQYEKRENGVTTQNRGLGDVSILANYVLLNSGDSLMNNIKHALQFGGGAKFPTGRNDMGNENADPIANLQPGTGSVDFLLNMVYTIRYKKFGLNNEIGYRINRASNKHYKFGDRFNAAARLFYWQNAGKFTLLPQLGLQYEHARKDYIDYHEKEIQDLSGGSRFFVAAGLDAYYKNLSVGIRWTEPLQQDFADGNIKSLDQLSINLVYMFLNI